MDISLISYAILCPLVFLAGFIDAIAGGGGLITLPVYVMIGLPPHNAIATNKLSSSMGTFVATAKYVKNGYVNWKRSLFCIVLALLGSSAGANLALLIPEKSFAIIMTVLLPLIVFYVLKRKNLESIKTPFGDTTTNILCIGIAFFIGMYDGFYGPGTGTLLMLLLTGLARISIKDAAGTTKVINLSSNLAALAVFLTNDKVLLQIGLIAGGFSILGNFIGAQCFTKNGQKIARPVILCVLVLFLAKTIIETIN